MRTRGLEAAGRRHWARGPRETRGRGRSGHLASVSYHRRPGGTLKVLATPSWGPQQGQQGQEWPRGGGAPTCLGSCRLWSVAPAALSATLPVPTAPPRRRPHRGAPPPAPASVFGSRTAGKPRDCSTKQNQEGRAFQAFAARMWLCHGAQPAGGGWWGALAVWGLLRGSLLLRRPTRAMENNLLYLKVGS